MMETREMYFSTEFQTRETENNEKYLEGYFVMYNSETELQRGIYEEILPTALTKSIQTNDIRCLFNHDTSIVLGRTGNGTLEIRSDDKGLWGRVKINPFDKQANDIYARIQRGDINACSFGFIPIDEDLVHRDDGSVKFVVKEAELKEVSAVTFPAYPQTQVAARMESLEQDRKRMFEVRKEQLRRKLNGTENNHA